MTNYYVEKNGKIINVNTDKQLLISTYGNNVEIKETEENLILSEDLAEFVFIDTDGYNQKQAEKQRTYLIEEVNYPLKAKVAYTGVRFDYNGEELIFETNKDSMSLISTTLVGILSSQLTLSDTITAINDWKCRKTVEPFEPVSVNFTIEQFMSLVNFGRNMISQAFAVEQEINNRIKELTVEQLNNNEFIETFEQQMELVYNNISVKLEGLFNNLE